MQKQRKMDVIFGLVRRLKAKWTSTRPARPVQARHAQSQFVCLRKKKKRRRRRTLSAKWMLIAQRSQAPDDE